MRPRATFVPFRRVFAYPSPHPIIVSQISSLVKKFFEKNKTRLKFFIAFSHSKPNFGRVYPHSVGQFWHLSRCGRVIELDFWRWETLLTFSYKLFHELNCFNVGST